MDRSAVEAIQETLAYDQDNLPKTDNEAVVLPPNANLISLEHLMDKPNRFKACFSTHIPSEFTDYCTANMSEDSVIYIDSHCMSAKAIFDQGNEDAPLWGSHTATIELCKKPAYEELLDNNLMLIEQQALIDFLSDWKEIIIIFDSNDQAIPFQTAINRIRKLTINKNSTIDTEQGDFKAKSSAMESVEIKSGEDNIPAYFNIKLSPYESFEEQTMNCKLFARTDGKFVAIKFRISGLKTHEDLIADEFRNAIKTTLPVNSSIYVGEMKLR